MKKIIISFYSFTLIFLLTAQNAFALFGAGDIVFDPAMFGKQVVQLATEIVTKGATVATQINTWNTTLKLTVLDPLGNAMIAVSLLKQQSNTINLVTGSLGGNQLLISNPEQWIRNQGLNTVRVSLGDLSQPNSGPYSDSLFKSLVASFKPTNSSLQVTLNNINSSAIPQLVQNNLCGDAALTQLAKSDVMKSDGTYDPTDLATRKQQLWNSLCVGNPSDPQNSDLAQRLQKVNAQRPDVGGWDTWLALTGGDNAYNKSVQATEAVGKKVQEEQTASRDDINRSGGLASPRTCTTPAQSAENGDPFQNISDAACRTYTLTNSGSAVNAAFQQAINAPMQRLASSFGSGVLGTLSTLLAARNTIGMLSNAFSGVSLTGGTTMATNSSPAQDLVGNPDGKKTVADPALRRLTSYSQSLDQLQAADASLQAEISLGLGTANQIQSCYQGLMTDFTLTAQYPGIGEALSYASSQTQTLNNLRSTTAQDSTLIAAARTGVSDTQTAISQSNSSEEISNVYNAFEDKVTNGTYPSDSAGAQREADYQSLKAANETDTMTGGTAYRLLNQCSSIRQSLQASQGGA